VQAAPMTTVIDRLRQTALSQARDTRTDGQLLTSFADLKDESAFAALVHRHGSMVFNVCHRVVRNHHDAEDAFQAAFLVLARKAASVRPKSMVANWLHGVALRTALKARAMRTRRQAREKQVAQVPEVGAARQPEPWSDLQPVLDEELNRLPANYRLAVLLCDLEGKPIKAAAEQLGWPQGTLAGRLARARRLLARRLTQRGIVLSGGALALLLSEKAASAGVSLPLAASTVRAAIAITTGETAATLVTAQVKALMEGVLKGMILTKLKTLSAVLLLAGLIAFGGGTLTRPAASASQADDQVGAKPASAKAIQPPKSIDETVLHGEWVGQTNGKCCSLIFGPKNKIRRFVEGRDSGPNEVGTYSVDWKQTPYQLEAQWGSQPATQAIMDLPEKGKLRIDVDPQPNGVQKALSNSAIVLTKREQAQPGSKQAELDADRDLATAEFYRQTRKLGSAHFYYELVRRRYPDSIQASRAREGLEDLQRHRIRLADGTEAWAPDPAQQPSQSQPPPTPIPPGAPITVQQLQELRKQAHTLESRIRALETRGMVQPPVQVGPDTPAAPMAVDALRQQIRSLDSRLRLLEAGQ
jgi:RNA polymerase sigma factor (sigma-70 family)